MINNFKKALQDVLVPEFKDLKKLVKTNTDRIKQVEKRLDLQEKQRKSDLELVLKNIEASRQSTLKEVKIWLKDFREENNNRFAELKKEMDERFTRVDERFTRVDKKFVGIYKRFEQVDKRFEQVDKRFEQVDKRFDELHTEMKEGFSNVNAGIGEIRLALMAKQNLPPPEPEIDISIKTLTVEDLIKLGLTDRKTVTKKLNLK